MGPHQASSIRSIAAPAAMPARMPPPVLTREPVVHSIDGGLRLVLLAQVDVLLEAAAAEDDAAAGADDHLGAVARDADADHPAALDDQAGQLGLVVDRDAGVDQALAQADRERVAHRVHLPAAERLTIRLSSTRTW